MSGREWFAVYSRLIRLPKFRALGEPEQLTLLYLWALAGDESPEAVWPSVERIDALLRFNGRPTNGVVSRLIAEGWLDIGPDGSVMVHDWDDWQFAATKEARDAYEAYRKREWRRQKARPADTPPRTPPRTSQHNTTQESGHVRTRPDAEHASKDATRKRNGADGPPRSLRETLMAMGLRPMPDDATSAPGVHSRKEEP